MDIGLDRYRIAGESPVGLPQRDPRDRSLYPTISKKDSVRELARLRRQLSELQRLLWADGNHALLVVLQALDTGGKDGTIRKVMSGVNPQGVSVTGFGVPTEVERAHDYMWRVHPHTPGSGRIAVFNRSHYEDVLVVRVNELVPEARWSKRFDHIMSFERLLSDEGTTIRKIMLHISKDEQRERLEARLEDPAKGFKFNATDLETRKRWDEYQTAYEDAIDRTATPTAPWFVVPADRKWYRNLVVARILIEALAGLDLSYPTPDFDPAGITIV